MSSSSAPASSVSVSSSSFSSAPADCRIVSTILETARIGAVNKRHAELKHDSFTKTHTAPKKKKKKFLLDVMCRRNIPKSCSGELFGRGRAPV